MSIQQCFDRICKRPELTGLSFFQIGCVMAALEAMKNPSNKSYAVVQELMLEASSEELRIAKKKAKRFRCFNERLK